MFINLLKYFLLFYSVFLFLFIPSKTFANEDSFITIVNPQRISVYNKDPLGSFRAQIKEVEKRNLPATWIITYDVLARKDFVDSLKKLNSNQELGIFLEVTASLARAANVKYNQTESWHYATSLFLSGYTQEDRKNLIDTVFKKFKDSFGYYPRSVGAWWVDSYSLEYMKSKYDITGTLGVSDQYDLDNYQIWGTWWSIPYYPSKIHAGIPAESSKEKIDVVTFRWAARDPINGYKNTLNKLPSLYSLQDYSTLTAPFYFDELLKLYALKQPLNKFGHATIGLEGDLSPGVYESQYANHLDTVKTLHEEKKVQVLTMKDFSSWYRNQFPISPNHIIESSDLLGRNLRSIWINTPFYRINILHDTKTLETNILDLRIYYNNFEEPFNKSPNKQLNLSINLPFVIDSVIQPNGETKLNLGSLKRVQKDKIIFDKGEIGFNDTAITFAGKTIKVNTKFPVSKEGIIYKDYSFVLPFAIKSRLAFPLEYLLVGAIIIAGVIISLLRKKAILILIVIFLLLALSSIVVSPAYKFYISQSEYDALKVLKMLPAGNVLVYDKDCARCAWHSPEKPAAMAGHKKYIETFGGKKVIKSLRFSLAKNPEGVRKEIHDTNASYIYFAKYEEYIEVFAFPPESIRAGLKKIYENANTQIWEIENK